MDGLEKIHWWGAEDNTPTEPTNEEQEGNPIEPDNND